MKFCRLTGNGFIFVILHHRDPRGEVKVWRLTDVYAAHYMLLLWCHKQLVRK